ncbi:conserved hypothetical protein [Leptospira interrogans serovar Manilae]|uniref:Uncharacterized protein n=1 Tax=Leptospira interrogans serovar Manilae TaxID=214675 RepID=A0AAQ1P0K9_LEPIR|nr:hypothetical protein [Leptospira interrogans]AKP25953.1 hypothetical protein LIMLP_08360 [Leptospira interrogans serovar Manilae]AKP29738.1 hypothetical protein LIMHP_08355 [Leptospira interrogans serovar Manilae]EYU62501.1 hypothetical protein CI00_20165 [Leptospira interrogans serovar Manilae]SOR63384.1 conserved hypothetical protein [Leptospira interrogans serovar Manilae]
MAETETPEIPKIYLFRLYNWSPEQEKKLYDKLKAEGDGAIDFWNRYEVPDHPEIKNFYFVPDQEDIVNKVKFVGLTNTSFILDFVGSFELDSIPESVFEIPERHVSVPVSYIILGVILLLIILMGVLR